jgi:hypothetical protein
MSTTDARRFHAVIEPVAATIFFAPVAHEEYAKLGLDPVAGYFCSRSAPMGRVDAGVVAATFYSFNPAMVRASLRWDVAEPDAVLAARFRAARETMTPLVADLDGIGDALDALRDAIDACRFDGRALAAAHAALPWPDDQPTALWHAATVLREYRGDGHIATLLTHGIDAVQALVLDAAFSGKPEKYYEFRQFDEGETKLAIEALQARAFLDADGTITEGGSKFREMIEVDTDRLASPAFAALTPERRAATIAVLAQIVEKAIETRAVPRFVERLYRKSF